MLTKFSTAIRALAIAGLTAPLLAPAASAGNHPLSGARQANGKTVFDIVVSLLDENPKGDNDALVDSGASDDEQNAFERRIQFFADAVYEMTNGAHQLGRVTIYKAKNRQAQADVKWEKDCANDNGPWANISSYDRPGGTIHMCTTWQGAISDKGSGYTLAHEWGHYAYGIYDEYKDSQCTPSLFNRCAGIPTSTDTPVMPSIMNCQWIASGDGSCGLTYGGAVSDFLEFSTPNLEPYKATSSGSTAHKRIFGESVWSTLERDSATDPFWQFLFRAKRTYYSDLKAPKSPFAIVKNTNTAMSRSELDIRWAGNPVIQLVVDRSGSMNGTPIANAKTASNILIDQLAEGTTALGIISFNSSATVNFPIQNIPTTGTAAVRNQAQNIVNGLRAGGGTNIGRALDRALTAAQAFDKARPAVVYLLSDGQGGTGNRATTIANYKAAGATIISFAYGRFSDERALRDYAEGTGGSFFQSPTTLADIQRAFSTANALFSSNSPVDNTQANVPAGATASRKFVVDGTMGKVTLSVSFAGSAADVDLSVLAPSGAALGIPFTCVGTTQQVCSAEMTSANIQAGGTGNYSVNIVNKVGGAKSVLSAVTAEAKDGVDGYDVAVSFDDAAYPQPMIVRAKVTKGLPLTGLTVVATVTDSQNQQSKITLLDDGKQADNVADDGIYSASVPYKANGNYNINVEVSNPNGKAQTTFAGVFAAPTPSGKSVPKPAPKPVTENFTRFAAATAKASGVKPDDHANVPTAPNCTEVKDDNTAVVGRIDRAGDVDCFKFKASASGVDLFVRVTGLTDGMDPAVTVFDSTGTKTLASFNVASSKDADNGAVYAVPASAIETAGHRVSVRHANASADKGGYTVSVGKGLPSDTANKAVAKPKPPTPTPPAPTDPTTPTPPPADSGGALDIWTLAFLMLLASGGLYIRRRRLH